MSVLALEENEILESYQPIKKFLRFLRHLSDPISALSRSMSYFLQAIAKVKFIPLTLRVLHYLPYASSVLIAVDNLSQIAVNVSDEKRSRLQKTLNITHAIISLVLTFVFSFTPAQPYAGLLASTATDFVFDALLKTANRIYKHFFGKVDDYRKEARELKTILATDREDYLNAKKEMATQSSHIPYKKVTENIAILGSYENKLIRLQSLEHEISKSGAKLKEKAYTATLSTVSLAGAIMLLIPGLQPIGAGLLLFTGTVYLTDKLFPIPFPWRKQLSKKPNFNLDKVEYKEPGLNTNHIQHTLEPRQVNVNVVANKPAILPSQANPSSLASGFVAHIGGRKTIKNAMTTSSHYFLSSHRR